jgi:hypothetical protein
MSNNVFQDVLTNADDVQDQLLGPTYPYYKNIKNPKEIGMSDKGTINALEKNINGLISYVEVLVSGKSKASTTGKPLGNRFFLKTGAKCVDEKTNEQVDRYIYINNQPIGNIPVISGGLGVNFSEFKGLIPGTLENLNALNPYAIMQSFLAGSTPKCRQITLQTIDTNNTKSTETNYVTLVDIQNMNPCLFPDKKNPITNKKCKETFTTLNANPEAINNDFTIGNNIPDDLLSQLYFASIGGLGVYIFYKILHKMNMLR